MARRSALVVASDGLNQQIQSGDTLTTPASVAGGASLAVPHGTAPTSPADGDFWSTTSGFFARINGGTAHFAPCASPALTGTVTVTLTNSDYTNTGGADTHLLLSNPSGQQSSIYFDFAGTMRGKIRADFVGNMNYATNGGSHVFKTGGDSGVGVDVATISGAGLLAGSDNTYTLGGGGSRWSQIYAATSTINTSDAREKTAVAPLTDAELAAAKALAAEMGTYQFLSSIAEKGVAARLHAGMTVQRAMEVMTAHGLDPLRYGFICHDAWPEVTAPVLDEEGDPTGEVTVSAAGDRYGFRVEELLLFLVRGFDARLAAIEAGLPPA